MGWAWIGVWMMRRLKGRRQRYRARVDGREELGRGTEAF